MKKNILMILCALLFYASPLFSQTAPPPPAPGSTGNSSGGSAPIGSGLFILLGLGAAYAGKKIYQYKKQENDR